MDIHELFCREARHIDRQLSPRKFGKLPAGERLPDTVTPRQREALAALAELRFASVKNLMIYMNQSQRNVQRYLAGLRDRRLVSWFLWAGKQKRVDAVHAPSSEPIYSLTTAGVERCILDRVISDPSYVLTRKWRGKVLNHSTMPHQLGVTDILLGLAMASRRSTTHEILETVPDMVRNEIDDKKLVATVELIGSDYELRADLIAHARAKILGRDFTFYIEFERTNKAPKKIIKKFVNYSALFIRPERRFNWGKPVLLYVIEDGATEKNSEARMKLVSSWVKDKPVAPAFRIATLSAVKENAFGGIWKKADGSDWSIQR